MLTYRNIKNTRADQSNHARYEPMQEEPTMCQRLAFSQKERPLPDTFTGLAHYGKRSTEVPHTDRLKGKCVIVNRPQGGHHRRWSSTQSPNSDQCAATAAAPEGTKYFIQKYKTDSSNWRTDFGRIIDHVGQERWPKPFQNLHSTRQTELEDKFPSHVVTAWMGNMINVAKKHYLIVQDGHFAKAALNLV